MEAAIDLYTDPSKYADVGHWPSIEAPDRIGDAMRRRAERRLLLGGRRRPRAELHQGGARASLHESDGSIADLGAEAPAYAQDFQETVQKSEIFKDVDEEFDICGKVDEVAESLKSKVDDAALILADIGIGSIDSLLAGVTVLILMPLHGRRRARLEEGLSVLARTSRLRPGAPCPSGSGAPALRERHSVFVPTGPPTTLAPWISPR